MCGIVGIASNKPVSLNIINSLKRLEYRGYDSAGLATIINQNINETKCSGRVNKLEEILFNSELVISMAGTATEQAIGLAKPVIQIEGKGPQFTKSFAEAQRRLLGRYIFCATNYKNKKDQINQTIDLIIKIIYLIKLDNKFLNSCLDNANQRIGGSNACIKIVNDIKVS